jgi:hypothetical protein
MMMLIVRQVSSAFALGGAGAFLGALLCFFVIDPLDQVPR